MTRPSYLVLLVALIGLSQGPALAQSSATGSSTSPSATSQAQTLPQRIQQKLQTQGFTDIRVVPEGYIVSAKDKDGDPVTMVIGPHSIAMFSFSAANNQSSSDMSEQGHYGSSASGTKDLGTGAGSAGAGAQGTDSMGSGRSAK